MHRIRHTSERLAAQAAEMAHIAALGLVVTASNAAAAPAANHAEALQPEAEAQPAEADRPLERRLTAMREAFAERADATLIETFEQGVRDVEALALTETALNTGDPAPRFELPDATGATVKLETLLAGGPVVVTFYRGGWCPYCNLQLRAYQERLDEMTALGATLVAISPEVPDESLSTVEKNELSFVVLSDAGNEVADDFGIRYRLPDELIRVFEGRLDLLEKNGDGSWTLPLGATFVIDTDGTIARAFLFTDYRERAEPQDIVDALRVLAREG